MTTHPCPVRGHDHDLAVVRHHTQAGTSLRAVTVECPTGRYRWFLVEGRAPCPGNRSVRPRWGWAS